MRDLRMEIKEDRRQFTRLKSELMLKCKKAEEKQGKQIQATTRDISPRGIFFESKQPYSINTILQIELDIPPLERKVETLAKVLRVEELLKKDTYGIGAIFLKVDGKDQDKILKYIKRLDINSLLQEALKCGASDLHLSANHPPYLRINGVLTAIDRAPLDQRELELIIFNMLTERQREVFERELELDIAYRVRGMGRFRVNIHMQQGGVETAIRVIPLKIRTIEELNLPPIIGELAQKESGMILVTGASGCGKSTTLAAMIDLINAKRKAVIVSIEDPIEYAFDVKKSIIKQREVNYDTISFNRALKHIFRQNPDVIFIGELRDQESIATAISCAEAGFFVLSTLHTIDTLHAVSRLIEAFPPEHHSQIRASLSECLQGIIAQKLLLRKDGKGRVPATEVLAVNTAVRNAIKSGNLGQIPSIIQTSKKYKMHSMYSSIMELYEKGVIDQETAQQNLIESFSKEFFYQARDNQNRSVSGKIEAIDREAAIKVLQDKGLTIVSVKEVS